MASSFCLHCLYENEDGNPNSPEDGFLKGPLLVRVSLILYTTNKLHALTITVGLLSVFHIAIFSL